MLCVFSCPYVLHASWNISLRPEATEARLGPVLGAPAAENGPVSPMRSKLPMGWGLVSQSPAVHSRARRPWGQAGLNAHTHQSRATSSLSLWPPTQSNAHSAPTPFSPLCVLEPKYCLPAHSGDAAQPQRAPALHFLSESPDILLTHPRNQC